MLNNFFSLIPTIFRLISYSEMKSQEFSNMNHESKVRLVWTKGKFVGKRILKNKTVVLYSLHNLFIELMYNNADNKLMRLDNIELEKVVKHYC